MYHSQANKHTCHIMGNITSRLPWRRTIQEDLDLWRVYQLLYYRDNCGGEEIKVEKIKQVVPIKMQKKMVDSKLKQQVEELLLERNDNFQLSVNPQSDDKDPFPIPGVRLIGHATPGSIVCFFPGIIYRPTYVPLMPNYPHISTNNPYLMATTNGSIIDAKTYNNYEVDENAANRQYAVGHLVRHPLTGITDVFPNIIPYTLLLTDDSIINPLVPNQYYTFNPLFPKITNDGLLTIVFLAMRHIRNEELLLNYRLHPDSKLPTWYTALDNNEDRRRWKEIKHLKQ